MCIRDSLPTDRHRIRRRRSGRLGRLQRAGQEAFGTEQDGDLLRIELGIRLVEDVYKRQGFKCGLLQAASETGKYCAVMFRRPDRYAGG